MSAAQVTEAHRDLTLRVRVCDMHYGIEPAAQLIADSEARAVGLALTGITCTHHTDEERRECPVCLVTQLRAEVEKAGGYINLQVARAETAEREVERLRRLNIVAVSLKLAAVARAERAEAEVSRLTDALDMMKDEFMRIIACPGCEPEIEDLANRAQLKLVQHVPVIVQRDKAEAELAKERARLDWLQAQEVKRGFECGITADDPSFLVLGEDGTTHWGNTYREAIDAAMKEDGK